jgi:hypothetical protein
MVATATVVAINPPLNLSDIVEKQLLHFWWNDRHCLQRDYPTSKMTSSSTGAPSGRLATPYTRRQGFFSFPENFLQQLRSGVSDFRLIADTSRIGHGHAEPHDPRQFVERSQMLPRNSEDIECSKVSRLAPRVLQKF